jgi:hypothetical protein
MDHDRLLRTAGRQGVPIHLATDGVALLLSTRILDSSEGRYRPTELALTIGQRLEAGDWAALARTLLASAALRSQALRLVAAANVRDGRLCLELERAQREGPQAAVLLSWIEPASEGCLNLPAEMVAVAVLEDVPSPIPDWVEAQARVGKRAEQYSLLSERMKNAGQVLYVAAERDDAGYDIEVVEPGGVRYIEVKGSRSESPAFNLTLRELREAERRGQRYEIQFWGGIDLALGMVREYEALTAKGYPMAFPDVAKQLAEGALLAEPVQFLVRPGP